MEAETREILTRARALIEDPERWCQYKPATDANGHLCESTDKNAARWCASGAIVRADSDFAKAHKIIIQVNSLTTAFASVAHSLLIPVVHAHFGTRTRPTVVAGRELQVPIRSLWEVNDYLGHAETIFVFDTALAGTV